MSLACSNLTENSEASFLFGRESNLVAERLNSKKKKNLSMRNFFPRLDSALWTSKNQSNQASELLQATKKSRKINTSPLCRPTSCCRRTFPSSELVVHTSSTLCQNFKCLPHLQPIFFLKKVIFPKVSKGNKGCWLLVVPLGCRRPNRKCSEK